MILIRLLVLPVVLAINAIVLSLRTVRFLGLRRLLTLSVGIGIGLLVAPVPGREMRARIRRWAEESGFVLPDNAALSVPPAASGSPASGPDGSAGSGSSPVTGSGAPTSAGTGTLSTAGASGRTSAAGDGGPGPVRVPDAEGEPGGNGSSS